MKSIVVITGLSAFAACSLLLQACSDDAHKRASTTLPLVSPHVRSAAPAGLGGTGVVAKSSNGLQQKLSELDAADIKSRFFTAGPTSLYQILGELDTRLGELNQMNLGCLAQTPTAYTFSAFGEPLTFYAQCAISLGGPSASPPSFLQVGVKDGVIYLFELGGAERIAARLIPAAGTTPAPLDGGILASLPDGGVAAANQYRVDAWIGVGYDNASSCGNKNGFDDCSYGVLVLHTDESRTAFELSVAGLGFGYCGAQLASDGSSVYALGSLDMGASCLPTDMLCVSAADVTTPASCASVRPSVAPALGRRDTSGPNGHFAASDYPGDSDNTIVLNGTNSDSLWFGPTEPVVPVFSK